MNNKICIASIAIVATALDSFGVCRTIGEYGFRNAFTNRTSITDVEAYSCEEIGAHAFENAFKGCTSLTSVKFNSVTNVGDFGFFEAFIGCSNLSDVQFGNLDKVGIQGMSYAFSGCVGLSSVSFPALNEIQGDGFKGAFNNTSVRSINFPSLRFASTETFSYNTEITDISIPLMSTLVPGMFSGCSSLTNIYAPEAFQMVAEPFSGNTSLKEIHLPKLNSIVNMNQLYIPNIEFADFPGLVDLPASFFMNLPKLHTVVLTRLETVRATSFAFTPMLKDINLPSVTNIENSAFGVSSVTNLSLQSISTNSYDELWSVPSGCVIHFNDGDITVQ